MATLSYQEFVKLKEQEKQRQNTAAAPSRQQTVQPAPSTVSAQNGEISSSTPWNKLSYNEFAALRNLGASANDIYSLAVDAARNQMKQKTPTPAEMYQAKDSVMAYDNAGKLSPWQTLLNMANDAKNYVTRRTEVEQANMTPQEKKLQEMRKNPQSAEDVKKANGIDYELEEAPFWSWLTGHTVYKKAKGVSNEEARAAAGNFKENLKSGVQKITAKPEKTGNAEVDNWFENLNTSNETAKILSQTYGIPTSAIPGSRTQQTTDAYIQNYENKSFGQKLGANAGIAAINYGLDLANAGLVAADTLTGGQLGTGTGQASSVFQIGNFLQNAGSGLTNNAVQSMKETSNWLGKLVLDLEKTGVEQMMDRAFGSASLIAMGARVFGSGAQEAENRGESLKNQVLTGVGRGAVEVGTEMLGGVGGSWRGTGYGDEFFGRLDKWVASKTGSELLGTLASAFGSEATEEMLADVLNPLVDRIFGIGEVTGRGEDETFMQKLGSFLTDVWGDGQLLYDGLLGGLAGMLGGAVTHANPFNGYTAQARNLGVDIATYKAAQRIVGFDHLKNQFQEMTGVELSEDEGNALTQVAMYLTNMSATTGENVRQVETNLMRKTSVGPERASAAAAESGIRSADFVKSAFRSKDIELNDEEVKSILEGYQEGQDFQKYVAGMREAYQYAKKGYSVEQVGKNGAFMNDLLPTQKQLAWAHGRSVQTATRENVDTSTEEGKERAEAALSGLGAKYAEAAADAYTRDQDINQYAAAMEEAVMLYGASGADLQAVYAGAKENGYGKLTYLTPAQITKAAEIGKQVRQDRLERDRKAAENLKQKRAEAQAILDQGSPEIAELNEAIRSMREYVEERQAAAKEITDQLTAMIDANPANAQTENYKTLADQAAQIQGEINNTLDMIHELETKRTEARKTSKGKRKKGTVTFTGGVIGGDRYEGVDPENLNRQQKTAVAAAQVIADALDLDIVFFTGPSSRLGAWQGDTLYINMNGSIQGKNGVQRFIVGATMSHELTHYLEKYNPEVYRELHDYVVQHILKKNPAALSNLVKQQMDIAPNLSYEKALNEVVANACQTMLLNSKAVRQLARENMTLAEKIADVLEEISGKIRAAFEEVDTSDHWVFEATKLMEGELDTLQEIWDRAITGAAENYRAAKTEVPASLDTSDVVGAMEAAEASGEQWSRFVEDEQTLKFLNDQEKAGKVVRTYKSFVEIDGKLYPPMASKKSGGKNAKLVKPMEVGRWEESVGNPNITLKPGEKWAHIDIFKDNGKATRVAYNPYQHSSNLMLNDQFSEAYQRPGLVTYECIIPESELTSGYRAKYAKDTVGRLPWKAGKVASKIAKAKGLKRDVFLSRWLKPVRRVPEAEVAQHYKELLEGTDIAVPSNVVPPALLKALEDAGVKIQYTKEAPKQEETQFQLTDGMSYEDAEEAWNAMTEEQQEAEINASMTMQQARTMLDKAFVAGEVKEWYEGKYRNGDEWLKAEGTREVAMIIENEYELQRKYINSVPVLYHGLSNIEEVLDAYLNGTLTGRVKKARERADLSKGSGYQDSRFYAPKELQVTAETWDLANQRATKKNQAEVNDARKAILFAAHSGGLEQKLGITAAELNKKLRQWSRYSAQARELSMRINQGVAPENQWTGIQNSSILSRMAITDDEIRSMVKDVNGDSTEYERAYIGNAMLALDTHINWSWLSFNFLRGHVDPNRKSVRGNYVNAERKINVGGGSEQHTVSHEMGHALDYQWERELFHNASGKISNPLTGNAYREDLIPDEEGRAFYRHFREFINDLMEVNDNYSNYSMEPSEIFARFVDKFVNWTQETAGAYVYRDSFGFNDRFSAKHFVEFARLLQEKAAWDAKHATEMAQWQQADENQITMDELLGNEMARSNDRRSWNPEYRRRVEAVEDLAERTREYLIAHGVDAEELEDFGAVQFSTRGIAGVTGAVRMISDLSADMKGRQKTEAYQLMDELLRVAGAEEREKYITAIEPRNQGFADWYRKKHPSIYYEGYKPGDLFRSSELSREMSPNFETNVQREKDHLHKLLEREDLAPEDRADAQDFLDRLNNMRQSREVFYQQVDDIHNGWAPEFFSKMNQVIEKQMPNKMAANQVVPWLLGKGVKKEEIRWSGIQQALEGKKTVTKAELQELLAGDQLEIRTVTLNSGLSGGKGTIISTYYYDDLMGEEVTNEEALDLATLIASDEAAREGYDDYHIETESPAGLGSTDYLLVWSRGSDSGTEFLFSVRNDKFAGDTHWIDFSNEGGSNYREILFQLPGFNFVSSALETHWGDEYGHGAAPNYEDTIAHVRVQDTDVTDPETDEVLGKMLFVEELQSDLHNTGSKYGFRGAGYTEEQEKILKDFLELRDGLMEMRRNAGEYANELYELLKEKQSKRPEMESYTLQDRRGPLNSIEHWLRGEADVPLLNYNFNDISEYVRAFEDITDILQNTEIGREASKAAREIRLKEKEVDRLSEEKFNIERMAPDAPFAGTADTYHEYCMKHVLRLAAEGGYDYVGWTTADQQVKRWSEKYEKAYRILYDQNMPKFMGKYTKQWGGKVEMVHQDVADRNFQDVWAAKITDEMWNAVMSTGQPLFQQVDDPYDDSVEESNGRDTSYTMLRSQAEILGELFAGVRELTKAEQKSLAEIQKRLNIGKTPEVRMSDARKLAKNLIESYDSTADLNEIADKIKQIGDYIVQSEDPTLTVPYDLAHEIAADIVENAQVVDESKTPDDTIVSIADRIAGSNEKPTKFVLDDPAHIKDTADYETIQEFNRAHLKFKVSVTGSNSKAYQQNPQSYVSIDQFYSELQNDFGESYFPQVSNEGEQLMVMAQLLQASAKEEYLNPFEQYMGEAIEAAAQELVHSVIGNEMLLLDFNVMKLSPLNRTERLQARNKELSEKVKQLVKENKMEQREASKLYTQLAKLNGKLAKAEGKYQALQQRSRERVAQVRAEGRARAAEVKARERARSAEKIYALKEYYRDMERRARERRNNTTLRHKIRALIDDLNRRLMKPSENKHVPRELVRQTIDVLKMIDYDSGRGGEKFAERLQKIRETYDSYEKNQTYSVVYDEVTAEMLKNLQETIAGKNIYGMTEGQLTKVYDTLKSLMHVIDESIKIRIGNEERDAFEVSREMTGETRAIPKAQKGWLKQHAIPAHLRPDVAFRRFGGFKKNSAWESIVRMLNDGQLKKTDIQMRLGRPFLDLTNQSEAMRDFTGVNFWGRLDKSKLVDIGLKDANGNAIKVTHDMAVGIYMDLLNEDNRMHFIRGGKTVPNLEEFYAGKGGFGIGASRAAGISEQLSELNHQLREAKDADDAEEIMAVQEQIDDLKQYGEQYADQVKANIEQILTEFDREWIRLTQHLMDVESKRYLNDTTMEVYGIEKATVEHYFPITSDPDFLSSPFESIVKDTSPENVGFMKERIKSGNPTLAMGTFTVVNNQIDRVSQYCGIMPALRNFNKVWNKTAAGYSDSLKKAVNDVFDKAGVKYIEDLIADLNHSRARGADVLGLSALMGKLRGNLAQTTLTLNVRVAMAQAASYPTAAAELGVKPLAKALARGGRGGRMISRADQELIATYSPLLYHRMQGYSSVELGDIKNSQRLTSRVWKKARWFTGWIQAVDGATVGRLWYAAEYWVQDNMPDLAKGSNEYYEQVAMKFNDVVEKTQPNYTTMQRPALLREPNEFIKSLSMFMTQRLQNFNILYDAAGAYQKARTDYANRLNDVTQADVTEARQDLVRAVGSQLAQAATYVGFKLIADMIMHNMKAYRDDDDELTKESVCTKLLDNFVDTMMGCMFLGSDLYAILKAATGHGKWYGLSLSGVDSVTDLIDNIVTLQTTDYDMESEKGRAKFEKQMLKVGYSVAQFLGIPANNAVKIKDAIVNHMTDALNGELGSFEAGVQSALSEKKLEGFREFVEPTGIREREYEKHLKDADVNGKNSPTQDELGEYLKGKLADKSLTKEQADAIWKAQGWSEKHDYDWWAGGKSDKKSSDSIKVPTETKTESNASEKKAEAKDPAKEFKQNVPLYSSKKNATYEVYERMLQPAGVSLDTFTRILTRADQDANGSLRQNELGYSLRAAIRDRQLTENQAAAVWAAQGWKTNFATWSSKH